MNGTRPTEALEPIEDGDDRFVVGPFYLIYNTEWSKYAGKGRLRSYKGTHRVNQKWLTGEVGYCFTNYFHALAYLLKIRNDKQESH